MSRASTRRPPAPLTAVLIRRAGPRIGESLALRPTPARRRIRTLRLWLDDRLRLDLRLALTAGCVTLLFTFAYIA